MLSSRREAALLTNRLEIEPDETRARGTTRHASLVTTSRCLLTRRWEQCPPESLHNASQKCNRESFLSHCDVQQLSPRSATVVVERAPGLDHGTIRPAPARQFVNDRGICNNTPRGAVSLSKA